MENTVARWKPVGLEVTPSQIGDGLLINGMRMQEAPILNRYPALWDVLCSIIMDIDSMTPKQLLAEYDEVFEEAMDSANMISLTFLGDGAQGRVSSAQGQVSGAQGQVSGAQGQVSGAQGQVSGAQGQVSGAQGQVSGAQGQGPGAKAEFLSFDDALAVLGDRGRLPPGPLLEAVLIAWSFGMCIELGVDDDDDDDDDGERHPDDLVTEEIMRRAASTAFVLCQAVFSHRMGAIGEALRIFVFNARASHSRCHQVTTSLNASMDACLDKMSEAVSALHLLMSNTALSQ